MMRPPCPLRISKWAEEKDDAPAHRCPDHGGEDAQPGALLLGLPAPNARRLSREAADQPPMGELLLHPGGAALPESRLYPLPDSDPPGRGRGPGSPQWKVRPGC